jgi:hypothetical protein
MATFLLLYSGGKMPEGEAETKQVMDAWGAWMGKYQDAIVDAGNPFTPVAKTVTADGRVSDGPVGEPASGYTVIKADSMDKAIAITKECPVLLGGAKVSLYETFDVMAMAGADAGHQH